jgi:hypothetical protein
MLMEKKQKLQKEVMSIMLKIMMRNQKTLTLEMTLTMKTLKM